MAPEICISDYNNEKSRAENRILLELRSLFFIDVRCNSSISQKSAKML
jgi:hypothetical protein